MHEHDIADVAVAALLRDGHHGRAYNLNGPDLLSRREQVAAIAAAAGREVRLEVVTPEQARERYRRQGGFAAANADFLLGFADYQGARREPTSVGYPGAQRVTRRPTAHDVTGRPARTFAQWARDHAADFQAED